MVRYGLVGLRIPSGHLWGIRLLSVQLLGDRLGSPHPSRRTKMPPVLPTTSVVCGNACDFADLVRRMGKPRLTVARRVRLDRNGVHTSGRP
jgi:hypothetical protein